MLPYNLKQRSFDSVHNPNWERKISVGEMGELKTIDELKRLSCAAVYNDFHIYDLKTMTSKTQRQVVAGFPTPTTDEAHYAREHKEFLTYLDAIAPDHLAMSMNRSPLELFGKEWKR